MQFNNPCDGFNLQTGGIVNDTNPSGTKICVSGAANRDGTYQVALSNTFIVPPNIFVNNDTLVYFILDSISHYAPPGCAPNSFQIGNGLAGGDGCDSPSSEHVLRYDYEVDRWVIIYSSDSLKRICILITANSNPYSMLTMFDIPVVNQTVYGLRFSIWGDFYNLCWANNCYALERSAILLGMGMPHMIMISSNTVTTLNQGASTRGPIVVAFPCGVALNSINGSIQMTLCQGLNFTNATVTTVASTTSVAPWNNGTVPIPTVSSLTINAESGDTEATYIYLGGTDKMAWAVTIDCDGINNAKIRWAEFTMNIDGSLTSLNGAYTYNPYPGNYASGSHVWMPVLLYDFNGTLAMQYSVTNSTLPVTPEINYRLATYPLGEWDEQRLLNAGLSVNNATFERGSLSLFGNGRLARSFMTNYYAPIGETNLYLLIIANETFTRTYTATDACGYTSSCTQQINLS
jgi:hypothetical protein